MVGAWLECMGVGDAALRFEMEWDKPLGSGLFAVVFRAQSKEGTVSLR